MSDTHPENIYCLGEKTCFYRSFFCFEPFMKCKNWRRTPRMDRSLGCAKLASRAALHALCGPWWSSFGWIRLPSLPYHFQYPIPTITMKSDIHLRLFVWHFDLYIFQGQCHIAERSNWLWCFRISGSSILAEHFHPNLNKFRMTKAWKSQHAQPFDFLSCQISQSTCFNLTETFHELRDTNIQPTMCSVLQQHSKLGQCTGMGTKRDENCCHLYQCKNMCYDVLCSYPYN